MSPNKLVLGTVQFGVQYGINNKLGQPSPKQVFEMVDIARDAGIDTLDTAEDYGTAQHLIGSYTENYINGSPPFKIISKLSPNLTEASQIAGNVARTLKMLKVNSLGGYLIHKYENYKRYPKLVEELNELKGKGLIEKIGISVYNEDILTEIVKDPRINILQVPFNLLDNINLKKSFLETAKNAGKEIHVRSVFLQGLFFMAEHEVPAKLKPLWPYLSRITKIANETGVGLERLALQYVYNNPLVDKVLIGIDTAEHLKQSLCALKQEISSDILAEVDRIVVKEVELLYPINWK